MYFYYIVKLITDDTKVYLTNEKDEVMEIKTAEEFKKDCLAAWLEVIKIEPINGFEVEIQVKS